MEVLIERGYKKGDLIVVVRFDKEQKNFNAESLKWVPTYKELDLIMDTKRELMDKQGKEVKEKELVDAPF